ncbi:MAG: galactose mutarotase [Lachnospiraceae bacterium]|nr:galactose mutarotase [Lachnospiraceae bacterium]
MSVEKKLFGKLADGAEVSSYTMKNSKGSSLTVIDYGGIITSIIVPDKDGKFDDVALGYDTLEPYLTNNEFMGATIGRAANRIAGARFTIDGVEYKVPVNENDNNLHTDIDNGFHKKLWKATVDDANNAVVMEYTSPDGENGFPGKLDMKVTFSLSEDDAVGIHYEGVSDKKTDINCTNHSYFNLSGVTSSVESIEDEYLKLFASHYNPVVEGAIPTGENAPVKGTIFDFTDFRRIGDNINDDLEQLKLVQGYDHNFGIDSPAKNKLVAIVEDRRVGRKMEVYTDLPGIQFYAGNCIRENLKGKNGQIYGPRKGLCLESQYFPNSVNEPNFESPIIDAGKKYDTLTVYKFGVI